MSARKAGEPRPTSRWVVTCLVLGILFTIAHSMTILGCIAVFEMVIPPEAPSSDIDMPGLDLAVIFVCCGVFGAPLFGILLTVGFISFKRRLQLRRDHCQYCGWKVQANRKNRCHACGAPHRNHCSKCAYDLTGNVSGVCPECGTATECEG